MKTTFDTLKNGKNAQTVWANPTTKEIYQANRNSYGYNALQAPYDSEFYKKYGCNMKLNQGKYNGSQFSYSAKQMQSVGFQLVMRGENILW